MIAKSTIITKDNHNGDFGIEDVSIEAQVLPH